ncbi:SET and MYND domain-containing protein 4-like isoform X1 [Chironomus tepperi]|uniref:SET and MYND domain-containing protein 4-like isoform X1 n=2 Tax=Chironomus tepperi TaxID=113505 RepID=UPI00391F76F6
MFSNAEFSSRNSYSFPGMPSENLEMEKSIIIASECRVDGNKLYSQRNFFDALVKYNESLCYAPEGSEAIGLAYANRSAVYFEMKMYEKCLKNIELAKLNGYPENNFHILDKRSQKCHELEAEQQQVTENPFEFVKLSYKANPRLPFVVNCLELRQSDIFGRYIVTTQDLNVGDILAIEEPHFKIIKSDSRYDSCPEMNKFQRCSVCLKDNLMDLIPCPYCISTMFCSEKCRDYAMTSYHNYECGIIDILLKTGIMQMAIRVFFQALNIFNGSVEDLQNFLSNFINSSTSVYDFDFSKSNEDAAAKYHLLSAFCLARSDKSSMSESPEIIFRLNSQLLDIWNKHSDFIEFFIARAIQLYDCNFHGICGWSIQKSYNTEPQMIGVGCYTFASLINHSCAPNINRCYVYDKVVIMVDKPIKKGEQLFDCYRSTFLIKPKAERQITLYEQYSFHCQCEACTKDYPQFKSLKSMDKKILKWAKKSKNEISKLDPNEAKKKFQEYCKAIQLHFEAHGYPSSELVLLQECLQECTSVILKPKLLMP